jgi:predicted Zn-dependent peptidase
VIVDERRTAQTVAVELTARAGARDDGAVHGVNVLTSRMMFQGTSRRPSETALQRAAAAVGGSVGRGTTTESSFYSSVVPADEFELAIDLVSDIIVDPLLDEGALDRQKLIALQEIAQRRASPSNVLDELFQAAIFRGHPAATPVLGTPDSVDAVTRSSLVDTRAQLWGASNLALTIVGHVRAADALAAAQRLFGALPRGAPNQRPPARVDLADAPQTVTETAGEQQLVFRLGFPTPGLLDADRYPLTIMNAIMTGSAGRLFRELRSARGLAYVAGSGYTAYTDAGAWFAIAGVDPQNLDPAVELVQAEVAKLHASAPTEAEVSQRLTQIAGRQIIADETNSARAGRLASQEILGTESTDEYIRRIRQVTAADVHRVAQTYLVDQRMVLAIVGPAGGGDASAN